MNLKWKNTLVEKTIFYKLLLCSGFEKEIKLFKDKLVCEQTFNRKFLIQLQSEKEYFKD